MTTPAPAPPKPRIPKAITIAAGVILGLSALGCVVSVIAVLNSPSPPPDPKYGAMVACEGFVKDRLKSPASADFSEEQAVTADAGWIVTGNVDAQNSFGAKLRSTFVCQVHPTGDSWTLDSISIT